MAKAWMFYISGARDLAAAGEGDPRETQQVFDRSLRLWADNEHRGCEGVFFGEHHFGGLNFNPSPHLLISALSQRTSHLRLGVMGSVLPLHDVRRLAEECGMLDYLTHGRLEIGIAPGVERPRRHLPASTRRTCGRATPVAPTCWTNISVVGASPIGTRTTTSSTWLSCRRCANPVQRCG